MTTQLISQVSIAAAAANREDLVSSLVPSPEGEGRFALAVSCPGLFDGFLAMANKPAVRTFSSPDAAWRLSVRLGIRKVVIDNGRFSSVAA
ncbi:TPA: hypothetical protein QDZ84_003440 [Shewanella algae]|uniref:hypothetical protein n=1 Tax=Shewanella TaxID=22 RepID=UPI00142FFB6F|nr:MULTISPECIES: hypothetical protein [Shewanella]NJI86986.1 hypothetical protein [Shewanella sp. Iso12]HDS1208401.1 hypothetical protein [Shewanella algae]